MLVKSTHLQVISQQARKTQQVEHWQHPRKQLIILIATSRGATLEQAKTLVI